MTTSSIAGTKRFARARGAKPARIARTSPYQKSVPLATCALPIGALPKAAFVLTYLLTCPHLTRTRRARTTPVYKKLYKPGVGRSRGHLTIRLSIYGLRRVSVCLLDVCVAGAQRRRGRRSQRTTIGLYAVWAHWPLAMPIADAVDRTAARRTPDAWGWAARTTHCLCIRVPRVSPEPRGTRT